jgi:hypothetical protein
MELAYECKEFFVNREEGLSCREVTQFVNKEKYFKFFHLKENKTQVYFKNGF